MRAEDDDRFMQHLVSASSLEVVLRGHLWVEAHLITLLEDVLPFPEQIDLGRFTYPQKVSLVAAHGFLRPEDVAAYGKLNSLRNKIAHRVHEEPGEEYATELLGAFGPHLRAMVMGFEVGEEWHWEDWLQRLRFGVLAMCINLSVEDERLAEYRRQVTESNASLRRSAQRLVDVAERSGRADA